MKKSYGNTVWKDLGEYAVWQPGDPVALGDYGYIQDGCFSRLGNVTQFIGNMAAATSQSNIEQKLVKSKGSIENKNSVNGLASLLLSFKRKHGVFLSAHKLQMSTYLDLTTLAARLASVPAWDRSWFVATTVREAESFVLLIAKSLELNVEGSASDLQKLMDGSLSASVSLNIDSDAAFKLIGHAGPLSVQLHRLKNAGNAFKHLDHTDAEQPTVFLAPYTDAVDEE